MSVMLYKAPGKVSLHGVDVDIKTVDADDVEAAQKDGWFDTPLDAYEAHLKSSVKKTRGRKKAEPNEPN